ncbi:MAG TPA: toll/interleukin-1 receptor domain-containing protein [Methanocella sp.]|jgi:outer membrane protein assembly factor BamB
MSHDVFISYSSGDKPVADAICHALESRKVRCWIAPRDVLPGKAFEKAILDAISDARVFVLVFSSGSNKSGHVESEVKAAWKKGIPIIPFRIEDVEMNEIIGYYISSQHWLDAITPPMEQHMQKLIDSVQTLLNDGKPASPATPPVAEAPAAPVPPQKSPAKLTPKAIALGMVAIVCLAIIIGALVLLNSNTAGNTDNGRPTVAPSSTATGPTPTLSPGVPAGSTSGTADADYYAMFGGNPQRTGVYNTKALTGNPVQKWAFRTNASIRSTPAVCNGVVYAGCEDGIFYAIDAATGSLKWNFPVEPYAGTQDQVESSPAVVDGIVYVASHYGGTLYALDADTGGEKWNYALAGQTSSSPCVSNGTVYIGSIDAVYAIDAKTGAGKWTYELTNPVTSPALEPSPAVAGGVVIASDYRYIVAIDAVTGTEKWRYQAENSFDGSASIAGNVVYATADGKVSALDLYTGDLLWKTDYVSMSLWDSSPSVSDGRVFKAGLTGTVIALDAATGKSLWTFDNGDFKSFVGMPSIVGDLVYIGCENGYLYALNAKTGMAQWKFKAKDSISSSAAVADGVVYVGSADHYLYALG